MDGRKMTRRSASKREAKQNQIPWEERLEDHNNKKTEYLENCLFRGCNPDTTIKRLNSALTSIFNRVQIEDATHPEGRRRLLCWDLLDPKLGATDISLISTSLHARSPSILRVHYGETKHSWSKRCNGYRKVWTNSPELYEI